jgi:hypothetical protein
VGHRRGHRSSDGRPDICITFHLSPYPLEQIMESLEQRSRTLALFLKMFLQRPALGSFLSDHILAPPPRVGLHAHERMGVIGVSMR